MNKIKIKYQKLVHQFFTEYDPEFLGKYLNDIHCVLEAGVFNGVTTLRFSELYPKAVIVGIEPFRNNFEKALDKLKGRPNITLIQKALVVDSKKVKNVLLYADEDSGASSSILKPTLHKIFHPIKKFQSTQLVQTCTFDEIYEKYLQNKVIDVFWLDIQGLELDILKSINEKNMKMIKLINVEVNRIPLYKRASTFRTLNKFLISNDFSLLEYKIKFISGNAIYINKNLISK